MAAAYPIKFASIQLIRSNDSQVGPHGPEKTGDYFFAGKNACQGIQAHEQTRDSEQHGDDRAYIYDDIAGRLLNCDFRIFVDRGILCGASANVSYSVHVCHRL